MAHLLYEVLGGLRRARGDRHLPPLPALKEAANELLRRALISAAWPDARSFWRDFVAACGAEISSRRELHIPQRWAGQLELGMVCKLTPVESDVAPIHLVARPQFRIGRSAQRADFITRFLPETSENADRTNELSRVHVTAEISSGGIALRDGNGTTPSRNGSAFENVPLSHEHPLLLSTRGVLSLGQYRLEVVPLAASCAWQISGVEGLSPRDESAPQGIGAVLFSPLDVQQVGRLAWLLDGAGFRVESRGEFVWHRSEMQDAPAHFLRRAGAFLLTNRALAAASLEADGAPITAGEAVPLRSGQPVRIGNTTFTVALS